MTEPSSSQHSKTASRNWGVGLTGVVFFCFFLFGELFPNYWWSTHFLHFLPPVWKYSLLGLAATLIALGIRPIRLHWLQTKSFHIFSYSFWIWIVAALMGFLFYQFPMVQDFYGEAYLLNVHLLKFAPTIPAGTHEAFFSFGLAPWDGQKTIFAMVTYLTHFAGITYREAFIYFDAFFGALFVLSWLYFLRTYLTNTLWKVILGIAGLTAPFLLNYYGHIEINAPVLLVNTVWMMGALLYIDNRKKHFLWGLFLLLFVCLKCHAVGLLFVPVWGLMALIHYKGHKNLSWKKVSQFLLAPIYGIGALCYFFVFEDHKDSRELIERVGEYDRLFLPLISPEPPLHKYNMLSFNHIFDYFSELLLWSPIAFFLLVVIALFYRKQVNWQAPEVIISGTALLLFGSLFFVTNPLLTMQMDWDLFSMPAPLFLIFTVVLIRQLQDTNLAAKTATICLALALLSVPTFTLHTSEKQLSYRLESVGYRIYHTYYEWAAFTFHNALGLLWEDRELQMLRKEEILRELHPYAVKGNDREYAGLWSYEGKHFLRVQKDYVMALQYLKAAEEYDANERNTLLYLMETYFTLGQPEQAYPYSLKLLEIGYPNEKNAYMAAIQCALEAGLYADANQLAVDYLTRWNDSPLVTEVYKRLQQNDDLEGIKELFQRMN